MAVGAAVAGPNAAARDTVRGAHPRGVAADTLRAATPMSDTLQTASPRAPASGRVQEGPDVAGPDTTRAPRSPLLKSARVRKLKPAVADTSRRQPPTDPTGFDQPRWVMLRSLVFPGWGQLHNRAWTKATIVAGVEGFFIARVVNDHNALSRLSDQIDEARRANNSAAEAILVEQYNARSDRFVAHQWWLGAVLAYSLVDAYIDAHFRNFRVDLEDDPALPPEERHAAGLKLSWQRHF